MSAQRLRVGLIGLGRLGRVYARDFATRIEETRLVAVCDPLDEVVAGVADEFAVAGRHTEAEELVRDPGVDAVVIVTPTRTHKDLFLLCARAGKPAFCEKPPALTLADALVMKAAVAETGAFLQMGFMRRFDPGYAAARARLSEGRIGRAVLFKSTSRDSGPPPLAYADPRNSGGLIVDLGIHDFDLARFFVGEVRTVSVAHDTAPGFLERFSAAYVAQLENFAGNVLRARPSPVTIDDGVEALRVALAARQALVSGLPVEVGSVVG